MASGPLFDITLALATVSLILVSCSMYALLYRLDKLRYGNDMQALDHCVIVVKILVAHVLISQLWLYHHYGHNNNNNTSSDFAFFFFLGGVMLLFICFRGSFSEVPQGPDGWFYMAMLTCLLCLSGTCLALVFYSTFQIQERSGSDMLLNRFIWYGSASFVSLGVVLGLLLHIHYNAITPSQAAASEQMIVTSSDPESPVV